MSENTVSAGQYKIKDKAGYMKFEADSKRRLRNITGFFVIF
jgi:hypothetical protein